MNITEAEETFCLYRLEREGSFTTSLIQTIFKADMRNRAKLAKAFPELVDVIDRYSNQSGYWQDLVERWNQKYPTHKLYE